MALPETAFTTPKNPFTHPINCPTCVANREALRRDLLDRGHSEETADRLSAIALNPALERVYSCGYVE